MTTDSKMLDPEQITHRLRLLADQASEHAIILLDTTGHVTWWNHGAEHLFRQSCRDAIGQDFSRIFTTEDQSRGISELEMAIARSNAISEDDRWHVRADGSQFWSTGALVPIRDSSGTLVGFGKIIRDRTNVKEQLVHLSKQVEAAKAADRAKEVGIATLAHELRNLLAAIFHGTRLLRSSGEDTQRRAELINLMDEHMEVIRRLTEDLLDVTRAHEGKISIQMLDVVLQEAAAKSIEASRGAIADKQLQVEFLAPRVPIVVQADAVRLHQVFGNLLDNAIKYTPIGGRIWVKVSVEDTDAVVRFEDNGRGIPPDMLSRVFDLFTQVDADVPQRGLGIGLTLVKNLIALHGGSVQARSEGLGTGCEFVVRLPLKI